MTKLDEIVSAAVEASLELRRLQSLGRLAPGAFVQEARRNAGLSEAELDAVERKIADARCSTEAIRAFTRKLQREFAEPTYCRPFADASKAARIWGRPDLAGEVAEIGVTMSALVALGAKLATEWRGSRFGEVNGGWDGHQSAMESARAKIGELKTEMRESFGPGDLHLDRGYLLVAERDRGLVRCVFKRWNIPLTTEADWPSAIIDFEVARHDAQAAARPVRRRRAAAEPVAAEA